MSRRPTWGSDELLLPEELAWTPQDSPLIRQVIARRPDVQDAAPETSEDVNAGLR